MSEPELPEFLEHPTKVDIALIVALFAMTIYSFALIPLRGWFLSHPFAYTIMVGGYTSAVVGGAHASAGHGHAWLYVLLTLFGATKFMLVYWYMGRRWGQDFIDMTIKETPRVQRWVTGLLGSNKAIAGTMALIPLGYAPGPVPGPVLNAVLGLLRVGLVPFLVINLGSVAVMNGIMAGLGYHFGDQVLAVIEVVNKYLLWVTLALLALLFFQMFRRNRATRT
ncbi:hypothetical protein [Corynebacterium uterequi]|uniref:Putative membrane-associated protein n=1 Tax=Corynebacterium uterequi TaxID=1072256 RepID=A0A0G3HJR7_9CORY|nr:hypothetical protein [Corynebacterium uterequi]AKK11367.1 putative membrane-associated protein [Corynebacterium uterequi]